MHHALRFTTSLAIAVASALLLAAGTASANRLALTNTNIRMTMPGLRFFSIVGETDVEVICPATIEGSFHSRTIVKTPRSLIGYITRIAVSGASCEYSGGADQLTILGSPWHIKYEGFFGGLPTISRFNIGLVLVAFLIRILGGLFNCLWRNEPELPLRSWFERNTTTGQLTRFEFTGSAVRLVSGSPECWDGHLEGPADVRLLGTATTLVFLTLI